MKSLYGGAIEMSEKDSVDSLKEIIFKSMELQKCRKCGCMAKTLETVQNELLKIESESAKELLFLIEKFINNMNPVEYT